MGKRGYTNKAFFLAEWFKTSQVFPFMGKIQAIAIPDSLPSDHHSFIQILHLHEQLICARRCQVLKIQWWTEQTWSWPLGSLCSIKKDRWWTSNKYISSYRCYKEKYCSVIKSDWVVYFRWSMLSEDSFEEVTFELLPIWWETKNVTS